MKPFQVLLYISYVAKACLFTAVAYSLLIAYVILYIQMAGVDTMHMGCTLFLL